jgi:hypothetical protein
LHEDIQAEMQSRRVLPPIFAFVGRDSVKECGAQPTAAPNISRFRQVFDASASLASRDRILI